MFIVIALAGQPVFRKAMSMIMFATGEAKLLIVVVELLHTIA